MSAAETTGGLFDSQPFAQIPGQLSIDQCLTESGRRHAELVATVQLGERCPKCGGPAGAHTHRMCDPCETAAWERIDALAKTQPPSTPANNVWD